MTDAGYVNMCLICIHLRNCLQNTADTQQIPKSKYGPGRSALTAVSELWVQAPELQKLPFLCFQKHQSCLENEFNELHPPINPQHKAGRTAERGKRGRIRNGKGANRSWGKLQHVGKETTLSNLKAGRDTARDKVQLKKKKRKIPAWLKCQQIRSWHN